MEWHDEAIVLSARAHGERDAVVSVMTPTQGRHAGLLPGGQGRSARAVLEPGNRVQALWRARLPEHLGYFTLNLIKNYTAPWLDDPEILLLMSSACAVTEASLPERQPMPGLYAGLATLLALSDPYLWAPAYVQWEISVLRALGFGLDLSQCAATGMADQLTYVSPRTGRAVSAEAGQPYKEKLFRLPPFLLGAGIWQESDIEDGLALTGHFLSRHVFCHPQNRHLIKEPGALPQARQRVADYYSVKKEKATARLA